MNSDVVAPFAATPPSRARGFSLLELLVALIVIVLITSLVTLGVGSGGESVRVDSAVRNLADVAAFALDEAQMTGQDHGLLLSEEFVEGERFYTYSWMQRNLEGWVETPETREIFAPQKLPPGIELILELDDAPVAQLELDEEDEPTINPQVVFYASGEATEGALEVRHIDSGDVLWRIEWDLLGRFTLMPRGIPPEED